MPPTGDPGGAGELGFPAAAAAVANAYARATGTTPLQLPDRRLRSSGCRRSRSRSTVRAPPSSAAADEPLLWVLRDLLGVTGPKYGCGVGVCKACTSHLDGSAFNPCITPVGDCAGRQVTTIEGLADGDTLHPVQQAWIDEDVAPVRLLPARSDHGRRRAPGGEPASDRRRHRRHRQRLPLRHLRPDPPGDPPGRGLNESRLKVPLSNVEAVDVSPPEAVCIW